ncbi:excalibur calcium-binding domain-containing protein [Mycolicibacterium helvum]|nr:excalibur calcium-binding domain-containing protein [Mycolicibacterium helvum]
MPQNSAGCYWTNCTQAHQNGEGDIPQGSAHYCSKQDRDSDGVACEW